MFDILTYVLQIYTEDKHAVDGTQWHLWCQDINILSHKGKEFANHSISDIIDRSTVDPLCTVTANSSISQLIFIFNKGLHRAIVVDEEGNCINVISQSNIIQFIADNFSHCSGKVIKSSMEDMGFVGKQVHTMSSTSRAIHAFFQMRAWKISAVAIVDKYGALESNLSVSDLRGLTASSFSDLLLPCHEFVKKYGNPKMQPPISVKPNDSFEHVVMTLAESKVHRVWVVNAYGVPCGLVSLTDIMRLLDLRVYINQTDELWQKQHESNQ